MNELELLGAVAAAKIKSQYLPAEESAEGQGRLVLDRFTDEEVGAISHAVLADPALAAGVGLRIPRAVGEKTGLPEAVLTDEPTVYWRGRTIEGRRVMLLANADDRQRDSMREATAINAQGLLSDPERWVERASDGLDLSDNERKYWEQALRGLQQAQPFNTARFAGYVVMTRRAIEREGLPLPTALGEALPALRAPRDRRLFNGIPEAKRGHVVQWKNAYVQVFRRRAPFLLKKSPTQQAIDAAELEATFESLCEQGVIPAEHHATVTAFIHAPAVWTDAARALAELDWEDAGIRHLFEGLRIKKLKKPLGEETRCLFEEKLERAPLTEGERNYLDELQQRHPLGDPSDEDETFYERHRHELAIAPKVKAAWDRFIFGKPIDCDDLRVGILHAVQRLYEQLETPEARGGPKELTVECSRHSARHWEELNEGAARYFAARYRGLPALLGGAVRWDPPDLFALAVADPAEAPRGAKKATEGRRHSVARAANQVKLTVTLTAGDEDVSTQVVWTFNPASIVAGLAGDLRRLAERPFAPSSVRREPVSSKGRLQALDLRDVMTLEPHGSQKRGSLLPSKDPRDLAADFEDALRAAAAEMRITPAGRDAIDLAWSAFRADYTAALATYRDHGTASDECLGLGDSYGRLLDALVAHATNDRVRRTLWEPVLSIGLCRVEGGDCAAIVTPWHPLRLVAAAAKDRRLGGLVRYLLRDEAVDFGDARLFFQDVAHELTHPFYPEVCAGLADEQVALLACTDSVGDYSLMEPPVRGASDPAAGPGARPATNDDPRRTAKVIEDVVAQFLALYPHEAANLAVVLFNCDAVGLPEAAVSVLSEMYDEDDEREVRCHVQLKHTDPRRLQRLYETLLEASARDTESGIASESTRDFMARLRVGIMAQQAPTPTALDGTPSDIVFLQDVVARLCTLVWNDRCPALTDADPRDHVPARWARRIPATRNDEHSAAYLCCPVQTPAGWSYLRALWGYVEKRAPRPDEHVLPMRRVGFQEGHGRRILDEAHRLGQWVVNYDEILSREHLTNLGVRVIRSRRVGDSARNVIVSSSAPLTLLHLLVRRNLTALDLQLSPAALGDLAERLVTYASEVSGDIVLRAARRSAFAHELIGVALSRYLLDDELGPPGGVRGWYFLDDYAAWLGQREGHIADILTLHPRREEDGRVVLVALVSEAKYVTETILQDKRTCSTAQVRQTVAGMRDALFETPRRLDRDHWLTRLADLLAEAAVASDAVPGELEAWRRAVAAGQMEIVLRGYSHVFVYTKEPDAPDPGARRPLADDASVWQEVFGPELVRKLLLAFAAGESPRSVRSRLGREVPWSHRDARRPAEGANWATTIASLELMPPLPSSAPVDEPAKRRAKRAKPAAKAAAPLPLIPAAPANPSAVAPAPVTAPTPPAPAPAPSTADFAWATPRVAEILRAAATPTAQSADDALWLERTTQALAAALRGYSHQAKVLDQRLTPNVALVRLQGSDRLKLWDVEQRRSQLLTTHGLNVVRVTPEPGALSVAIARPKREVVSFATALRDREVHDAAGRANERLVVGVRERDGALLYLDPLRDHAPHTLIAGGTGSGKSVLLQNLLLDLAMTNAPGAATVTLIDPKQGVDYGHLEALPHLDGGIVVEQAEAIERLRALVDEMEDRYRRLREAGVTNLAAYNAKAPPERRLPVRWLVHDEFADWMLTDTYKEEVQSAVQRLGVKARAAGIRLLFAAQRPEDRVMPVQLRDNLGNRLILRVESVGTSTIALGEEGAERLLGKGHLAARLLGEEGIVYAQVPMVDPDVVAALVTALRAEAPPR